MHYAYILGHKVSDAKPLIKVKCVKKVSKSIPLPDNWNDIRTTIIERDTVCVECGSNGHGVHHRDRDRTNNGISSLVYLCWPCHRQEHNGKG